MHLKVRQGTPDFNLDMCETCKFGKIIRGVQFDQQIRTCNFQGGKKVPFKVVECKDYLHRNQPYVSEMEEIAWILVSKGKEKQIGFVRVKDLSSQEKHKYGISGF